MSGAPVSRTLALLTLALAPLWAQAQTQVNEAWARATVAPQKASGAFMQLRSAQGARLLGASSPQVGRIEIHEMRMEGSTMRMRALDALDLPPGQTVALKPGGFHLMLFELKAPLQDGSRLPLTLQLQGKDGKPESLTLELSVRAQAPAHAGH